MRSIADVVCGFAVLVAVLGKPFTAAAEADTSDVPSLHTLITISSLYYDRTT